MSQLNAVLRVEWCLAQGLEARQDRAQIGLLLHPALGSDIGQTVVVAVVAEEGSQDRIATQDAFPVILRQLRESLSSLRRDHLVGPIHTV